MATLRHQHGRRIAVPAPEVHYRNGGEPSHTSGNVFDVIDRPLRLAAGDDAVLLKILRGAVVGFVGAAVAAVGVSAII